jgi:hypothetical protein
VSSRQRRKQEAFYSSNGLLPALLWTKVFALGDLSVSFHKETYYCKGCVFVLVKNGQEVK